MNIDEQVQYLMQGTDYGDDHLKKSMETELRERLIIADREKRPLRVYTGYDPTKADLHLGHTVTMRKMRQFQELGHEVVFLIGNFTSLIGDPSDKNILRPQMTPAEVEENARTYAEQAFVILDPEKTIIRYNNEWLSKLTFAELIKISSNFTLQQLLSRENFKLRWEKSDAVYLHETFYSIMQGYDAYALKADVQIGGTDQLFNIVTAARKIMTYLGSKPNVAIILGLLPGTDGVEKMSKSLGNHIPINTDASDMYGKVMSIPDSAMPSYMRLVTRWTPPEIKTLEDGMAIGTIHPRDAKMRLSFEITSSFYTDSEAEKAQQNFIHTFQKREVPSEMKAFPFLSDQKLVDVLVAVGLAESKGEARRLIEQKGVKLDGVVISDPMAVLPAPGVLQSGKRRFIRLV